MTATSIVPASPSRTSQDDVLVVGQSPLLRAVEAGLRAWHMPVRTVADMRAAEAYCTSTVRHCVFVVELPPRPSAAEWWSWEVARTPGFMKWLQEKQAAVVFLFHFDELLALNRVLVEPSLLTPACDFVRLPSSVECEAESGGWVIEVILRVRRLAEAWQNTNDEGLFDPKTGRYDASRVANFLRVPLKELAKALGAKYTTVQKTPAAVALQEKLGPIGRVVELLVKFHGSQDVAREWLNTPHRELDERTPLSVILDGHAQVIRDMLEAAYAGIPS